MGKAPKYVSAAYLSECTSLTARWFTGQACEGKIPGAVQPAGPGGAWRFDEARLWVWWNERGREPWQLSTRGATNGGAEHGATVKNDGNLLERLLGLSPGKD